MADGSFEVGIEGCVFFCSACFAGGGRDFKVSFLEALGRKKVLGRARRCCYPAASEERYIYNSPPPPRSETGMMKIVLIQGRCFCDYVSYGTKKFCLITYSHSRGKKYISFTSSAQLKKN